MIARRAASVILAGAVALGMTGCSFIATQATLIPYQPSDGVAATAGDIEVHNAIALSADGTDVALVLNIVNNGSPAIVTFQVTDAAGEKVDKTVYAAAGLSSVGNTGDDQLVFENVGVTVGSLLPVYLVDPGKAGEGVLVPVLDGTLPEYAPLLPLEKVDAATTE